MNSNQGPQDLVKLSLSTTLRGKKASRAKLLSRGMSRQMLHYLIQNQLLIEETINGVKYYSVND